MPRAPPPPHNSCAQGRATDIASTLLDKPDRPPLKSADRKSLSGEAARWNGSSTRMVEGRACRATLFQTDLHRARIEPVLRRWRPAATRNVFLGLQPRRTENNQAISSPPPQSLSASPAPLQN